MALHDCTSNGMRLASIASKEENDRLVKQIRNSGKWFFTFSINFTVTFRSSSYYTNYSKGIDGDFWLAGTNLGNKPHFYWMSHDTPMNFTDWQPNEPNELASNENCVELRKEFEYRWNDNWCDFPNYFVCEGVKSLGILFILLSNIFTLLICVFVSAILATLPGQRSLHDFIGLRSAWIFKWLLLSYSIHFHSKRIKPNKFDPTHFALFLRFNQFSITMLN